MKNDEHYNKLLKLRDELKLKSNDMSAYCDGFNAMLDEHEKIIAELLNSFQQQQYENHMDSLDDNHPLKKLGTPLMWWRC